MKLFTWFVVFVYLVQSKWATALSLNAVQPNVQFISRIKSPLDCTQYKTDYEILSSFSFITYLNPLSPSSSKTYGLMDANETVYLLNIANQRFVPITVFCLKSLRELYIRSTSFYEFELDDNSIRGLPSEIALLASSLKYLGIFDTTVTHLSDHIGKLTYLQTLELSNTGLVALPDSIGNLSSLLYLRLPSNKLTLLPTTMGNLRNLRSVTLFSNPRLHSIQSLNGLPSLNQIDTRYCPIERLPLDLPNLYYLYMANNNLTDLVGIRTLGNDTNINKNFLFTMNRIRYIPPQIRYVRSLYRLELNHNELATLPLDIFNVTSLRYLDIRDNLFSGIELRTIAAKFNATNPALSLQYLPTKDASLIQINY